MVLHPKMFQNLIRYFQKCSKTLCQIYIFTISMFTSQIFYLNVSQWVLICSDIKPKNVQYQAQFGLIVKLKTQKLSYQVLKFASDTLY